MTGAPVAAIDCGTNSIRLLIARRAEDGTLEDLERHMEIVRLGYGVDRTGRFDPAAVQRTLDACRRYAELIRHHGAEELRFVATSATRDASNREEFIQGVRDILGVEVEVISGDEEAELSFRGAVTTLPRLPEGRRVVIDIGGGSTELVLGTELPDQRLSLDMGSVRITERHLLSDPPTEQEIAAARADIETLLDRAQSDLDLTDITTVVSVAGTSTTLTALAIGATEYSPDLTHGAEGTIEDLVALCSRVLRMSREERASHRVIHPGRIDVLGGGALIWECVLRRLQLLSGAAKNVTSEHDILDGIALSVLDRNEDADARADQ